MNAILKNTGAVVLGWFGGSLLNMGLIQAGHAILPIPGLDPNDMDALAALMPTLPFKYFIFPFLAHALGTLLGAIIAFKIASTHKAKFAYAIGVLFLFGGIAMTFIIKGPIWFTIADLVLAYIPMSCLALKIVKK
ncbi:hypothetical protein N9901_02270 [Flavobacteriaceae bacterium]|nr:hypothetical protein [Flavobacteriaceae bacterium]